jgi:hypothetical protein
MKRVWRTVRWKKPEGREEIGTWSSRNWRRIRSSVVPVAADDHRRRELDGMEIEREIGESRRKGSSRVQSFLQR